MSEEKKIDHDFDGIEEFDNPLPGWWLAIFWVTIAIAIVYPIYYHKMHPDKLPAQKYEKEMAALVAEEQAKPKEVVNPTDLMAEYTKGGWQESAAVDFKKNCAVCHRDDGGGVIGPNFHDDFYIHGGKFEDFIRIQNEGVLMKGMTPFASILKPEQIKHLAFYIYALRGTPVENPKEPQGQQVDADGNFIEASSEEAPEEAKEVEAPAPADK